MTQDAIWITLGVRGNAGDALLYQVTRELFDGRISLDFRSVSEARYIRRRGARTDNVIIGPGGLMVQTNSSRHLHAKLSRQWDKFESKRFYLWSTGVLQEPSAEDIVNVQRITSRSRKIVVRASKEAEFLRKIDPTVAPEWGPCASLFTDRLLNVKDRTRDVVVVNFDSFLFNEENIVDHPLRRFVDFATAQGLDVRSMVNAAGDSSRLQLDFIPLIDIDERPFGDLLRNEPTSKEFHQAFTKELVAHPSMAERYVECRFAFGKRLHAWLPFLAFDKPAAFIGLAARRGMPRDYFGDDEFLADVPRRPAGMTRAQLDSMADGLIAKLRHFIANEDDIKSRIRTRREELWHLLQRQAEEFTDALE